MHRGALLRRPTRPALLLALAAAAASSVGCASAPARADAPAAAVTLTLLDTVIVPTTRTPPNGRHDLWFGSLSGLARDPRTGRYLGVIDDRDPSRVAWLAITVQDGRLSVVPEDVTPIRPGSGISERAVANADLEAVVALPDGTFIASEEGHVLASERGQADAEAWPPVLLSIDRSLRVTRVWPWPDRFELGPEHGGVRDNQGFEGLTRTPDGRLIAGLEQPLYGDMPARWRNRRPFGGGAGGPGRLIELVQQQRDWVTRREWVYPLDPTAVRAGEEICDDGENGLTELLALDAMRLFALERGCLRQPGRVRSTGRLYLVDTGGADDVSPRGGVPVTTARPVSKQLLVDFDTLIPNWPPELADLDNFEVLAFGPALPDGGRTLLVASDDNFRPNQHTVFLWFRIDEARTGTRR